MLTEDERRQLAREDAAVLRQAAEILSRYGLPLRGNGLLKFADEIESTEVGAKP